MTNHRARYGPHNPDETYVAHGFAEQLVDLGEVQMNYATRRRPVARRRCCSSPARPSRGGATRRRCRCSPSTSRCSPSTCAGQGRSTRTPGRYTLDNMGNDLVRFIDLVIGRPTIVSGLSSGGVLSAWLSAYAKPGQVVAVGLRGPAAVRVRGPAGHRPGPSARASARCSTCGAPTSATSGRSGRGTRCARRSATHLPEHMSFIPVPEEPPQNLKEYDPEWGRPFWTGTSARRAITSGCCAA